MVPIGFSFNHRHTRLEEEMEEEGPATAQDRREQEQEMKAFRDLDLPKVCFFFGGGRGVFVDVWGVFVVFLFLCNLACILCVCSFHG